MERVAGVEPASLAWEARVIPIYDTRLEEQTANSIPHHGAKATWRVCLVSARIVTHSMLPYY